MRYRLVPLNRRSCAVVPPLGDQEEDTGVYAVVTGLFEQAFTISREFPLVSGGQAQAGLTFGSGGQTQQAGIGSATKTEG